MELFISTIIIWSVILIPPVTIRALRSMPLTKLRAGILVAGLFVANHLIFAALTGGSSGRTYLLVGAFVSYFVLTWQSKAGAKKAVTEERRYLGYDLEAFPVSASSNVAPRAADSRASSEESPCISSIRDHSLSNLKSGPERTEHVVLAPMAGNSRSNGWLRLWVVVSLIWATVVLGRLALELNGEVEPLLVDTYSSPAELSSAALERARNKLASSLGVPGYRWVERTVGAGNGGDLYDELVREWEREPDEVLLKVQSILDETTPPALLARPLDLSTAVELANKLKIGWDTVQARPDEVVMLVGLNDLLNTPSWSGRSVPPQLRPGPTEYQPRGTFILAAIALPIAALLGLGLLVAWVRRGFLPS